MLSLISCFAGGVFLATCLLDLLPDYLQSINEAFSNAGITVRPHKSRHQAVKSCQYIFSNMNTGTIIHMSDSYN